ADRAGPALCVIPSGLAGTVVVVVSAKQGHVARDRVSAQAWAASTDRAVGGPAARLGTGSDLGEAARYLPAGRGEPDFEVAFMRNSHRRIAGDGGEMHRRQGRLDVERDCAGHGLGDG